MQGLHLCAVATASTDAGLDTYWARSLFEDFLLAYYSRNTGQACEQHRATNTTLFGLETKIALDQPCRIHNNVYTRSYRHYYRDAGDGGMVSSTFVLLLLLCLLLLNR